MKCILASFDVLIFINLSVAFSNGNTVPIFLPHVNKSFVQDTVVDLLMCSAI